MKRMISGIKPSGILTLGSWIGAIREFVKYQNDYELFIFIADLHALTIYQESQSLQKNITDLVATYLAAGLDPKKCILFRQSDIAAHTQLEWVLTCNTDLPDLLKMPQYKAFVESHKDTATPTGMLLYPSLMNSDLFLYDADYVPIGVDQVPHITLAKDVAKQFNKKYHTNILHAPEAIIPKVGAKIMSLSNPTKKMSKSESDKGTIYLTDTEEEIKLKIKRAITDSENKIYYDPVNKPGVSNLLTILAALTNKSIEDTVNKYKYDLNYKRLKDDTAEVICKELATLQKRIQQIKQSNCISITLDLGAVEASRIANKKVDEVYKTIGLRKAN
jgi:tryptophanyl-tRNA synthetase